MLRILFSLTLFCVLFFISGCGNNSRPKDLPKLYPCIITITQDGKPLEGASVELAATEETDQNNTKYKSLAITDVEGKVAVSTYGYKGVPIGKYKVVVTKNIDDDPIYKTNPSTGREEIISYKTYKTVEPQFSDVKTTPHKIEITGKGKKVEITFDVGKAIKVKF